MNDANSDVDARVNSTPWATSIAFVSAASRISAASRLIFDTIAAGVPVGASNPNHCADSNPGRPASAELGTSGAAAIRFAAATVIAFSLPEVTSGIVDAADPNPTCTCPLTTPNNPAVPPT